MYIGMYRDSWQGTSEDGQRMGRMERFFNTRDKTKIVAEGGHHRGSDTP